MKKLCSLLIVSTMATIGYSQLTGMFVEIKGITQAPVPILSYSGGISTAVSTSTGTTAYSAGKANFEDISLSMVPGKLSAEFLKSATMGTRIPELHLTVYGGIEKMIYRVTLQEVIVTNIEFGSKCTTTPCIDRSETISLNYNKIRWEDFKNSTSYGFNRLTYTSM